MAVATRLQFIARFLESQALDLGTSSYPALIEYPTAAVNSGSPDFATGTASYTFDRVWTDDRTLTATSEALDLHTSLTSKLDGSAVSFVEVGGIVIHNTSTTSELIIGGAASNQAFANLFGAATERIKVQPLGLFVWFSPIDGAGLVVTNTSADQLKIDAGAATITYRIALLGRSA